MSVVKSNLLKAAGVKHGFSERGESTKYPYSELNVKSDDNTPDDPQRVANNRKKIIESVGLDGEQAVFLRSLPHGNTIFEAHTIDAGHEIDGYDSIVTADPITIGLSVADCVPVLMYDPKTNTVAAVHAGWRGTRAQVVAETIKMMKRNYKIDPLNIRAVIGPSICGDCYEIGDEVAELFDSSLLKKEKGRQHLDLRKANAMQLQLGGVKKIEDLDLCTIENVDRFFSVRGEGQTGRFMAFIHPKS